MSIVMSHCHYSFTLGKGHEVHYDLPALERHFLSRFVYGKPLFDLNTASVLQQRKDIHNSENFAAIRRNVYPQVIFAQIHTYPYIINIDVQASATNLTRCENNRSL